VGQWTALAIGALHRVVLAACPPVVTPRIVSISLQAFGSCSNLG
jgi:hypothetical protein